MLFYTNNSEVMRFKSDQKVGIGESVPLGKVHIKSADVGAVSVSASGDEFVIEGTGSMGMTFMVATGQLSRIMWATPSGSERGSIRFDASTEVVSFVTGGLLGGQWHPSTTGGETRLAVWDVTKGAASIVHVGAANSAEPGYKHMMVPN
jgi:hypothetical protein